MVPVRGDEGDRRPFPAAARTGLIVLGAAIAVGLAIWGATELERLPEQKQAAVECKYTYDAAGPKQKAPKAIGFKCVEGHSQYNQSGTNTQEKLAALAKIGVWLRHYIHRLIDDPINILTLFLVGSTVGLWASTRRLWKESAAQAQHIETTAKAAKASADALTVIERAHLYPIIVGTVGNIDECIRAARRYGAPEGASGEEPTGGFFDVQFHVVNGGKTPGVLRSIFVSVSVLPREALTGVVVSRSFLAAGEQTELLIATLDIGLSQKEAAHIAVYTKFLAFFGELTFFDIWEAEYKTEFSFFWEPARRLWELRMIKTQRVDSAQDANRG